MTFSDAVLPVAFAVIATLYASVGQGGATGYIAAMALAGFAPDVIKPTALALNTSSPPSHACASPGRDG